MRQPMINDEEETPIVYTVPQAAKLLQMSPNTVYGLIAQNLIPHTRFGKLIRIPKWSLLQFIAQQSGAPLPPVAELDVLRNRSVHANTSEED